MTTHIWNPTLYDQKHSFVFEYGKDIVSLLAPQRGELILDVGCGTGHLTQQIAESGARVVGLDSAASMIETACQTYPDIEFVVADAAAFTFPYAFDAVFSNAALHWIPDATGVVAHVAQALKPGGRFVAEFGGQGNIARITAAVQSVVWEQLRIKVGHRWYFPSVGEYASLLEQHGFEVNDAALFDRLTKLEGDDGMRNWFVMFGDAILHDVPADTRPQIVRQIEERLRGELFRDGNWYADYRRLRVVAQKV